MIAPIDPHFMGNSCNGVQSLNGRKMIVGSHLPMHIHIEFLSPGARMTKVLLVILPLSPLNEVLPPCVVVSASYLGGYEHIAPQIP